MTRRLQCQTPSGEQSQASERPAPPDHSVPGARAYRHCTLRGPGPQIQEVGVTIAICAQTGERPHRAYTLAPPLLPSKGRDRKSTRLNSSHTVISYAVFCLKTKKHARYRGET